MGVFCFLGGTFAICTWDYRKAEQVVNSMYLLFLVLLFKDVFCVAVSLGFSLSV